MWELSPTVLRRRRRREAWPRVMALLTMAVVVGLWLHAHRPPDALGATPAAAAVVEGPTSPGMGVTRR